jgi:hypothetical protein
MAGITVTFTEVPLFMYVKLNHGSGFSTSVVKEMPPTPEDTASGVEENLL